ncbi:MAG: hypothetical protein AAF495_16575 [Pseudomonadota bacterium]
MYEIREANVDSVCFWLSSELKLSDGLDQAVRETEADPSEVLLGLLYEAKRVAQEHGISGDDLLLSAMTDRVSVERKSAAPNGVHKEFREVVRDFRERQISAQQTAQLVAAATQAPVKSRLSRGSLMERMRRRPATA